MKPVNLIPAEQRRNTSVAGRSGGGVYVVLGALALLVLLAAAYAVTTRSIADKRATLAQTHAEVARVSSAADRMREYSTFQDLRRNRAATVAEIARSRFDWSRAMRELARTVPAGVSLSKLDASTGTSEAAGTSATPAPGSAAASGGAASFVVEGCAESQDTVARTLVDLRRIEGVQRVSLTSSKKSDPSAGTAATGGSSTSAAGTPAGASACGGATFSMTVAFKPPPASAAAAPAATTAPASTGASK